MKSTAVKSAAENSMDLVYGLGSTGLSVARYMRRHDSCARYVDSRLDPPGAAELETICANAETVFGETPNEWLEKTSRMIVSPGIADTDAYLQTARKTGIEVVSDIELFVQDADAPFVAITGSNGKSTVTTLLEFMCKAAGKSGHAGGNLGLPALDLLSLDTPDFYLLELSSFQLQRTNNLPAAVAVLLNLSPDHLDWHESEREYRAAKYRIFSQAKAAVFNRSDNDVLSYLPKNVTQISFGLDQPAEDQFGLIEDGGQSFLARGDEPLLAIDEVAMLGMHNVANALAALAVGELIGLDVPSMLQVLNEFPGLPHRMEPVARVGAVTYINDSKATNVGAAIAAVESIRGNVVLISGGQGKGGDFEQFATATADHLKAAILIGEDAKRLAAVFTKRVPTFLAKDMRAAVTHAAELAECGDAVLLAPACASFDMYVDYKARGDDFRRQVEQLAS